MLDIKRIKEDPEKVKAGLRAKEVNCDQEVDRILALDLSLIHISEPTRRS